MQSNPPAVPVPNPNADWRQQMNPESWRVLLRGRLDDLDNLHHAYCAVEQLAMPHGVGDEANSFGNLQREHLGSLLEILNDRFGGLLLEAREAYKGSAQ
jgi:hypothetical protein